MELSNKIRRFRFENDEMTQKQLAELVGVSRQTMNAIENSKHAPTVDVAIRIADVFGVSIDEMCEFDYDGKPERPPIVTTAAPPQPTRRPECAAGANVERVKQGQQVEQSGMNKNIGNEVSLADLRGVIG